MRGLHLLAVAVLVASVSAEAEPFLQIRARSQLDVEIARVRDGVNVHARLVDANTGAPIGGRTVAISVEPLENATGFFQYAEPSSATGELRWHVPLALGKYRVRLQSGGDDDYAAAAPFEQLLDLHRRSPVLRLTAPPTASVTSESVTFHVEMEDDSDVKEDVPVTLAVGDQVVARLQLGVHPIDQAIAVGALGSGGRVTVTARFAGDALRNPTEASVSLFLTSPTQLTLHTSADELPWNDSIELFGELTGAKTRGQIVTFWNGGRQLGQTQVGDGGGYRWRLRGGTEALGPLLVEARFEPPTDASVLEAARSTVVGIQALGPTARSPLLYLLPLILLLAVMAGPRLRARLRQLRQQTETRPKRTPTGRAVTDGRRTLLSRLGPATDRSLGGIVRSLGGGPITAELVVRTPDFARTVLAGPDGRFAVDDLPDGELQIEVSSPAHLPERFLRSLPHHGELRAIEISLTPVRARILKIFETLASSPSWAGIVDLKPGLLTPRELLELARRRRLIVDDLEDLTALVEKAYFGREAPALDELRDCESRAEALSHPAAAGPADRA